LAGIERLTFGLRTLRERSVHYEHEAPASEFRRESATHSLALRACSGVCATHLCSALIPRWSIRRACERRTASGWIGRRMGVVLRGPFSGRWLTTPVCFSATGLRRPGDGASSPTQARCAWAKNFAVSAFSKLTPRARAVGASQLPRGRRGIRRGRRATAGPLHRVCRAR
jgi:hypothetical protein